MSSKPLSTVADVAVSVTEFMLTNWATDIWTFDDSGVNSFFFFHLVDIWFSLIWMVGLLSCHSLSSSNATSHRSVAWPQRPDTPEVSEVCHQASIVTNSRCQFVALMSPFQGRVTRWNLPLTGPRYYLCHGGALKRTVCQAFKCNSCFGTKPLDPLPVASSFFISADRES